MPGTPETAEAMGQGIFFSPFGENVLSSACDFKHYIMDSANLRRLETWIDLESQTGKKKKLKRDC